MKFEHHKELSDEEYAAAAKIHVSNLAVEAINSEDARREYGRWMITSLVVAHSAALAGILRMGDAGVQYLSVVGWYFIVGVVTAFLSGLCASTYFAMNTRRLFYLGDPSQIYNRHANITIPKPLRVGLTVSYVLSVISGLTSTAMIFIGAAAMQRVILAGI